MKISPYSQVLAGCMRRYRILFCVLDVLIVNNIYRQHIIKFTHLWHQGLLPVLFQNYFQYASSIHGYNTRYASKHNLYKHKKRTNSIKQTVAFVASVLRDNIPIDLKNLNVFNFSEKLKHYLLSEEHSETLSKNHSSFCSTFY